MSQNTIEIISVTFSAGESKLFAINGNYFEVIEATGPIDVILSEHNGEQRGRMMGALTSFYSKDVQFGVIQITSATVQTVRFAYGTGDAGSRRSSGSVSIIGPVNTNQQLAATDIMLDTTATPSVKFPLTANGMQKISDSRVAQSVKRRLCFIQSWTAARSTENGGTDPTGNAYIAFTQMNGINSNAGFELKAGETLRLDTVPMWQGEIWAYSKNGATLNIMEVLA